MKNSGIEWIGEIPDGWEIRPLKYLFSFEKGLPITKADLLPSGIKVISYGQIHAKYNRSAYVDEQLYRYVSEKYLKANRNSLVQKGDFIFADTSEDIEGTGDFVYIDIKDIIFAGYHSIILRHRSKDTNKYLAYLFMTKEWKSQIQSRVSGIKVYSISRGILAKALLLLPPMQRQCQIVEYLDKKCAAVDRLIENQRAQIEKLKEYKQSVITEAVTRGLDPSAPLKDSGVEWIGNISTNHFSCKLKFLLKEKMTYGANESGEKNPENKVRYIRITDITSDGKLKDGENNLYLSFEQAKPYLMHDNDVLFARSGGTVGKTFLYKSAYGKCAFAGYLIKAQCDNKKLIPKYLIYYTQSSLYDLWKNMIFIQATIQNIGAGKYENLEIIVADMKEQERLVAYLDKKCAEIDKLIAIKQQKIETLTEYKKSLIYEYVTGKKQVG